MNKFRTEKKMVPIDKIMPNRWNPNIESKEVFDKVKKSIEEHGLVGSAYVRKVNHTTADYELLDGEHRWKAAKELGFTEFPVEDLGDVSEQDAQMMTIMFNNLRGKDDIEKRAAILSALESGQLALLPWDQKEIKHMKDLVKFDFSQYDDKDPMPDRPLNHWTIFLKVGEAERKMWDTALEIAKKRGEANSAEQLFMKMLKFYLGFRSQDIPEYLDIQIDLNK